MFLYDIFWLGMFIIYMYVYLPICLCASSFIYLNLCIYLVSVPCLFTERNVNSDASHTHKKNLLRKRIAEQRKKNVNKARKTMRCPKIRSPALQLACNIPAKTAS